ncbi:MAG: MBL fold metallo-hydrolase [Candidatus Pacearchaeota archaeon]|nr:MBL fold metallo-hydrolase [Candidatus Pacearchaeota archaeon]
MRACALASGSSGNAFYVENENQQGVLIDLGISAKKVVERLALIKRSPENIKSIFVTHEHSDHVKGVDVFARNFGVPIFLTKETSEKCFVCSDEKLINFIKNKETVRVCGMDIRAFPKSHNCADPVSYSIFSKRENRTVSVITDMGHACKNVCEAVSDSNSLFIESNHDSEMLSNGPYPHFLKKWISSDIGHMSNFQTSICILEYACSNLKTVVLSHLSEVNNTPGIALKTTRSMIKERKDLDPKVFVSERHNPSEMFRI